MNLLVAIKKNIPNTITCLNLLCGAVACIFALKYREEVLWGIEAYEAAFVMIALAAVFDFLDGLAARLLNVVSAIGKELDSLCDCVSFGLAPGLIMYSLMQASSPDSWLCYVALIIPILGAVRLAKFNVDTRQTTSFIGMPIPANAIFWIGFASWYANNLNLGGYPLGGDSVAAYGEQYTYVLAKGEKPQFQGELQGVFPRVGVLPFRVYFGIAGLGLDHHFLRPGFDSR